MPDFSTDGFDFDGWMHLAKTDPEKFEEKRAEAIESIISSAPESSQRRLRGLQWRIDMERKRCKTPLESCVRIYDMLIDYVYSEKGLLNCINQLTGRPCHNISIPEKPRSRTNQAKILPLKRQAAR